MMFLRKEHQISLQVLTDYSVLLCSQPLYRILDFEITENLIGKGGCNEVYKGFLEDGKAVAVKILKPSVKEAVKEYVHEVSIISSLCHQNISPLIGVCVHYNDLISVYNLASRGSLEETLQG